MNDRRLLRLLQSDPNEGMTALMKEYSGLVFSVVKSRLEGVCDSSEIEDCVADAFIAFQQGLDNYRGDSSIKSYLCRLARNIAYDYLKNRYPAVPTDEELLLEIPDGTDLEQSVAERDLARRVYAEISRMKSPDREILFRKFYLGESSKKIAGDLDLTVSNVDTRTHRAIEKLKAIFQVKN